jgi:type I restriction enzyme S subunit
MLQEELSVQLSKTSIVIKKLESNYKSKIESLEELKKSILQKVFAGELTHSRYA